jgi:hypothetical protein
VGPQVVRYSERPELWDALAGLSDEVWPEYNLHGATLNQYWGQLYEVFPDWQFVLYDPGEQTVLAEGHTVPVAWDGTDAGLGPGIDATVTIERYARWTRPDGTPFDPWMRVHTQLGARIGPLTTSVTSRLASTRIDDRTGVEAVRAAGVWRSEGGRMPAERAIRAHFGGPHVEAAASRGRGGHAAQTESGRHHHPAAGRPAGIHGHLVSVGRRAGAGEHG